MIRCGKTSFGNACVQLDILRTVLVFNHTTGQSNICPTNFHVFLVLFQVFTCGSNTHSLRRERNVVTVMLFFMSDTLSSNTRRPTRMRNVLSVNSVTTAADRCVCGL